MGMSLGLLDGISEISRSARLLVYTTSPANGIDGEEDSPANAV